MRGGKCSKRFMDVYFRHFVEKNLADEEIADRLCMSVAHVKKLKRAMELRNSMKDEKVIVPVEHKSEHGIIEVEEEKRLDFDVVSPTKLVVISHAPKEKQLEIARNTAEKGLTKAEVQKVVAQANIDAGKQSSFKTKFSCPLCGSQISKKKFEGISSKEVKL